MEGNLNSSLPKTRRAALLVHLINRCNLECLHCYVDAGPQKNVSLPFELIEQNMSDLGQLDIGYVNISGGEPFLHPRLKEVLEFFSKQPATELFVSTNGTLIRSKEAALLKNCGAIAQISIDGPEDFHDRFRQVKGAFRRTARGIRALVEAQVPVALVITVCQDNIKYLPWLAEWAHEMGVDRISVQPLLQLGRGSDIKEKRLSDEQLCDLFLQLSDLRQKCDSKGLRFNMSYQSTKFLRTHPCAAYVCNGTHCHRKVEKEIKKIVVREDGTVLPETPTLDYQFALGNLREGKLNDLISRYFRNGYEKFDCLCRTVYHEVVPNWTAPLIPWNEILSERSKDFKTTESSLKEIRFQVRKTNKF